MNVRSHAEHRGMMRFQYFAVAKIHVHTTGHTMKASAQKRKRAWERQNKGQMHTVVLDDTNVYNAKGAGEHDDSKRVYYYRRGVGSFRLGNMHPVASADGVKKLIEMPAKQLPPLAKKR